MRKTAPHKRGVRNHNAKLDLAKVREILSSSKSNAELARELGVSAPAVSNVRTGRTWGWIDECWDLEDDDDGDELFCQVPLIFGHGVVTLPVTMRISR